MKQSICHQSSSILKLKQLSMIQILISLNNSYQTIFSKIKIWLGESSGWIIESVLIMSMVIILIFIFKRIRTICFNFKTFCCFNFTQKIRKITCNKTQKHKLTNGQVHRRYFIGSPLRRSNMSKSLFLCLNLICAIYICDQYFFLLIFYFFFPLKMQQITKHKSFLYIRKIKHKSNYLTQLPFSRSTFNCTK